MLKIIRFFEKSFTFLSTIFFISMLIAVLIQIFARYFLPASPAWTEEITRYLLIYVVALSVGNCIINRELVNVDILLNLFPPKIRNIVLGIIDLIIMVFFIAFAYFMLDFLELQGIQRATTLPIPMSYITYSLMLLCINAILFSFFSLCLAFSGKENPYHQKTQNL